MDVTKVNSLQQLLQQSQVGKPGVGNGNDVGQAFADLLRETSEQQRTAGGAAEQLLTTGEGELHRVQLELAKADLSFRFLVEVRNKLTEAYQEVSRMPL